MEGITPGPWGVFAPSQFDPLVVNSPTRDIAVLVTYDNRPDEREADARFIASAPSLVRELCEEVDKLRALLGEVLAVAHDHARHRLDTLDHIEATCESDGILAQTQRAIVDQNVVVDRLVSIRREGGVE
jgi:hypothetical protein